MKEINTDVYELSLEEFLFECETVSVGFELNDDGELEFYGGKLKNIERLKGILNKSKELKFSVMELAEYERLNKSFNKDIEPFITCVDYPSMKRCHVADLETRRIYKEMCERQYGTLNRYLFSYNEKLFNAGLIEHFYEDRYFLTWPEYDNVFAL